MANAATLLSDETDETNPVWADNKVRLAEILGVSRQTVYDWSKLPGCPGARSNGKYKVHEWIGFVQDLNLKQQENPLGEKAKLEARKLKIFCDRTEWKFACERKEWTETRTIGEDLRRLVAETIALIRHEFESTLPRAAAGKTAAQIRALSAQAIDRIMTRIHAGAQAAEKKYPPPEEPDADPETLRVGARVVMSTGHKWEGERGEYLGEFKGRFGIRSKIALDNGTGCMARADQFSPLA